MPTLPDRMAENAGEMMMKYPVEVPSDLSEESIYKWVTEAVEVEKRPPSVVIELDSVEATQELLEQTDVTLLCFFPSGAEWPRDNLTIVAEAFPQWRVGVATSTSVLPQKWVPADPTVPLAVLARHHEFDDTWIEFKETTTDGVLDWSPRAVGEFVDSAGPPVVRRYGRGTGRTINRIVSYSGLAMMLFLDPVCVDQCIETATPIARKHFVPNHIGEVTFVLFHPDDAPVNGGIYQFFGLEKQSQLPQIVLVDSKDADDSDGTHANMKVFPVPMLSPSACDGAAMEKVITQYLQAIESDGQRQKGLPAQSFQHIKEPHAIYKLSLHNWQAAVEASPLLFLGKLQSVHALTAVRLANQSLPGRMMRFTCSASRAQTRNHYGADSLSLLLLLLLLLLLPPPPPCRRRQCCCLPVWMAELYSPTCPHCKALEPEFAEANKTMDRTGFTDLRMMAMDGTSAPCVN